MKTGIKKIFGDLAACGDNESAHTVKSEPVFPVDHEHTDQASGYSKNWRGFGHERSRGY